MSSNVSRQVQTLPVQQQISTLERRMKSASADELLEGLQVLFAALPSSNAGEATELRMRAYVLAIDGVSVGTLREVITAILRGTAGLDNPKFVPTPPELAQLCQDRTARLGREVEHLRRLEAKERGDPAFTDMPSPQVRARVSEGFQQLGAALGNVIPR